jgi:hypothetical protein|tara:strand:- start:6724 stop:7041 length:318 start_codon:yes stop_codon:yes gene_type:complete
MKKSQLIRTLGLVVFIISSSVLAHGITQSQVEQAIATAEKLLIQSAQVDHQWSTAEPLIKQAKKALQLKQYENAYSFAQKASQQSTLALKQADTEQANWALNLPK